ncbi:beta-lactams repressor [Clostridioides difficile]|nr:beta-lactams repressor [Clostridioides difficile]
MKYQVSLLAVKDIEVSKKFYKELFEQEIELDLGHYEVLIKEKEYIGVETRDFFRNIHDSSIKSLLLSLHENINLSKDDILLIEEWIKNLKEEEKDV